MGTGGQSASTSELDHCLESPLPRPQRLVARAVSLTVTDRASSGRRRRVLSEVELEALSGEVFGVTGPGGAGKTSLLHLMAGLIQPTTGVVELDSVPVRYRGGGEIAPGMGLVPQTFGLALSLTCRENVAIPLQLRRLERNDIAERVDALLESLGLQDVADQLTTELSGGEQQRTAVARAVVAAPGVMIADEPTSELDHQTSELVLEALWRLARGGAIVVVASHDGEVIERCDRMIELHDGRVTAR